MSLPVRSRDRGKALADTPDGDIRQADIVKRAKHETFWVRPEWGFGRVLAFWRGAGVRTLERRLARSRDNQDSLSKSNDTDREFRLIRLHS